MTDTREVATQGSTEVEATEREFGVVMIPPADVFEDADGITLRLDMPGSHATGSTCRQTITAC